MKLSKANPKQAYFLQKKTVLIIIITLTSIPFIYLFARNIPSRIAKGNHGRVTIKILDEVRRPFLDIHRTESFLISKGYSKTVHESLKHEIDRGRHLIADFKTISAYNTELFEQVEKLASTFEEWIKTEQVLFNQPVGNSSTSIDRMSHDEIDHIRTSEYFDLAMVLLGEAEIPIHNDIEEGSLAVTEIIIVGGTLLVILIITVLFLQWLKNKKLRELFSINNQTENRLQTIMDNTTAVIYMKDTRGRYLLINHQYEKLFHINKQEIIGKTDYEIFPEDKADAFSKNDRKVIESESPMEFEEIVPHDDGLHTYISLKFPLFDTENIAYGVCGISTDVTEHRLFEQRLTSLAHILEESLNEIYIFDAETLGFIQVNKGARLNLGYSMEELSCLTPLDITPEVTPESFEKLLEPLRAGKKEKIQFTTVHQRKDGSLYGVEVHLQLSTFQSNPVFIATILDITERKQVEDALRESEEKSRLLLNSTGEAIYGIGLDGDCTFCNPSCLRLLGYEDENQLLGRNMHDMIHHTRKDGTQYPVEECCIYQAFREGKGTRVDSEVLWRANGTSFPVEYQSFPIMREGKTIGSVVSFVDITERKIAENHIKSLNDTLELRVTERTAELVKLSRAVEHSSSTVVITDTEGDIEYVNPRFTQTTGYTSEEALGQNPRILKSDDQGAEVYKELWETITSGNEWRGEFHNKKKNGELYWELASISPIKDKDGVITNFVAVKEDITDRKLMEEELKAFNSQLEQRIAERTSELTGSSPFLWRKIVTNFYVLISTLK